MAATRWRLPWRCVHSCRATVSAYLLRLQPPPGSAAVTSCPPLLIFGAMLQLWMPLWLLLQPPLLLRPPRFLPSPVPPLQLGLMSTYILDALRYKEGAFLAAWLTMGAANVAMIFSQVGQARGLCSLVRGCCAAPAGALAFQLWAWLLRGAARVLPAAHFFACSPSSRRRCSRARRLGR